LTSSFLALYARNVSGNHSYSLQQVLEVPGAISNVTDLNTRSYACPVQISTDLRVIVWGWSSTQDGPSTSRSQGAVFVAYLNASVGYYALSQTLKDFSGIRYNSTTVTYRAFGSAIAMSGDYRTLMIATLTVNYNNLNNPPDSSIQLYSLAKNGTAWPPVFEFTAQTNLTQPFCVACDKAEGNSFGMSMSADVFLNNVAVGAPSDFNNTNQGSVYYYAQRSVAASVPEEVQFTSVGSTQGFTAGSQFGSSVAISPDGYNILIGTPYANGSTGGAYLFNLTNSQTPPFVDVRGEQYLTSLPFPFSAEGLMQGTSVGISVGTTQSFAAIATPTSVIAIPSEEEFNQSVCVFEAHVGTGGEFDILQTIGVFGPAANAANLGISPTGTYVTWDGAVVVSGGSGSLQDMHQSGPPSQGSFFIWSTPYGTVPGPTVLPVACDLAYVSGYMEIPCTATPTNGFGFNVSEFLELNTFLDPCHNVTSGMGHAAGFATWPTGFVTYDGVLHGNGGATCSEEMATVALYIYCSADSQWDCALPNALDVTRIAPIASVYGNIRPVTNNVFTLYYSEPPPAPVPPTPVPPGYTPAAQPGSAPSYVPGDIPMAVPSTAPALVQGTVPANVSGNGTGLVPGSAPSGPSVPNYVPGSAPQLMPGFVDLPPDAPPFSPYSVPGYQPGSVPQSQPSTAPYLVQVFIPDPPGTPPATPYSVPAVVTITEPSYVPGTAPSYVPAVVTNPNGETQPETIPGEAPRYVPGVINITQPGTIPAPPGTVVGYIPGTAPATAPGTTPKYQPASVPAPPGTQPGYVPGTIPSLVPGTVPASPGTAPTLKPGTVPASVPGYAPGYKPGTTPALKPGTVPAYVPGVVPAFVPGFQLLQTPAEGFNPGAAVAIAVAGAVVMSIAAVLLCRRSAAGGRRRRRTDRVD
jgi:hypothetical protein